MFQEIVPLRKICRRPETDHRLQQLHAMPMNVNPQKSGVEVQVGNSLKIETAESTTQKQLKQEPKTSANPTPESKLQPSKAADAGNANTVATANTAASDAPPPPLQRVVETVVAKVSTSV